jgi:hypothetical protein
VTADGAVGDHAGLRKPSAGPASDGRAVSRQLSVRRCPSSLADRGFSSAYWPQPPPLCQRELQLVAAQRRSFKIWTRAFSSDRSAARTHFLRPRALQPTLGSALAAVARATSVAKPRCGAERCGGQTS